MSKIRQRGALCLALSSPLLWPHRFSCWMEPLQSRYGIYSTAAIILSLMIIADMVEKSKAGVSANKLVPLHINRSHRL